jgi:MFS transporter, PPP family, 3-phenylpropionic acid transporter
MTHPVPAARLATFYFFYFAFLGAFAPFWPLYLKSVGLSAAQIGTLLAVVPVTRMFGPALWGWLADHRGRRIPIVRFTATMTLLAFAGAFFGETYAWLFAVIAVMNLFWCGSLPLVEATTMAHLGDRFTQYGKIRAWGSVGFVLVVVGTGQLLDFAGVRSLLWLILGLLALHAASAFFVTEAPRHAHHDDVHGVWAVVRRPEVLALFAGCFLMSVSHGPFHTFYSIWLVDHGYSKGGVGALWALGVLAEIIVFFTWTRLSARVSPRPMLLFAYATAAVRFLAVAWLPDSLVVAVICQIAHAATFGCFHGAAVALTHRFFRGRHQSKGQALYSGVGFGAGGAVGGLMSGYLWDHAGGAWTFTAGAIAGLLAVGVTARWLKVGRDA